MSGRRQLPDKEHTHIKAHNRNIDLPAERRSIISMIYLVIHSLTQSPHTQDLVQFDSVEIWVRYFCPSQLVRKSIYDTIKAKAISTGTIL
jgi:hypothetical protein